MAFTTLKGWEDRQGATAFSEAAPAQKVMSANPEAETFNLIPPAIDELGNSSGFTLRLQDRGGKGYAALKKAEEQLLALAAKSSVVRMCTLTAYPMGR